MRATAKTLVPALAIAVGGYLLYRHVTAKPAPVSGMGDDTPANAQNPGFTDDPARFTSHIPKGHDSAKYRSHLAPMQVPTAFWSEGGWVGPVYNKPGGTTRYAPQPAPLVVDAYVDETGQPVLGAGPASAPKIKCLVDQDRTILQVLRPSWKETDNVAGLGSFWSKISQAAKVSVTAPLTLSKFGLKAAMNPLSLSKQFQGAKLALAPSFNTIGAGMHAAMKPLSNPNAIRSLVVSGGDPVLAAAVNAGAGSSLAQLQQAATTAAARGDAATVQAIHQQIQAEYGAGATSMNGLGTFRVPTTAYTPFPPRVYPPGHTVIAGLGAVDTFATATAYLANGTKMLGYVNRAGVFHAPIWSHQLEKNKPSGINGLLAGLGFHMPSFKQAVEGAIKQPLKIADATLQVAAAPLKAIVKTVQTGSFSQGLSVLKTGTITDLSTAVKNSVALATGKIQSTSGNTGGGAAAAGTSNATATGWPSVWTNVPGLTGWQYGDAGDGSGDGVVQNVTIGVGITATPAMLAAAGGTPNSAFPGMYTGANPVTVINQYLAANPTAAQSVAANPTQATGLVVTGITTGLAPSLTAQSAGWPAAWTAVPGYGGTLIPGTTTTTGGWMYMATQDGSGNGSFTNSSTAQSFTATPAMIGAAGGNAAMVLQTYLGGGLTATGLTPTTGLTTGMTAQQYAWPTVYTPVPGNPQWNYMAATDGTGGGMLQSTILGKTFEATPANLQQAGGVPATVISLYMGPAGLQGAAYYNWPLTATAVPSNPAWTYQAAFDGSGNGTFTYTALGITATVTPAMLMAAAGNPSTVLANYLAANPTITQEIANAGGASAQYDSDTGSGLTTSWDGVPGDPGDPNMMTPGSAQGVPGGMPPQQMYDQNGNPIPMGPSGGAPAPAPTAPAPAAGGIHWGWMAGAAVAVPAFLYAKAKM
jgi:hypothetical protein